MRSPYLKMLIFSLCFIVLTGLACFTPGQPDPTATLPPTNTSIPEPTLTPNPTPTNTTPPLPTNTPTTEVQAPAEETEAVDDTPPAYFTEEFEGDLGSWSYFLMNGNETNMDLYSDNGRLVFDLQGTYQWVYVLYDEYTYESVRIDVLAENRGKNTNNVSLICNYTDALGWYEFNISNGGLYDVLIFSEVDGDYFILDSGGSTAINMGRAENVYTAICEGNHLWLYINGVLEKEVIDNTYNLREGQVGVSVSSFDVTPILVEIDYFSISAP